MVTHCETEEDRKNRKKSLTQGSSEWTAGTRTQQHKQGQKKRTVDRIILKISTVKPLNRRQERIDSALLLQSLGIERASSRYRYGIDKQKTKKVHSYDFDNRCIQVFVECQHKTHGDARGWKAKTRPIRTHDLSELSIRYPIPTKTQLIHQRIREIGAESIKQMFGASPVVSKIVCDNHFMKKKVGCSNEGAPRDQTAATSWAYCLSIWLKLYRAYRLPGA